jgi:segregation and condensation protein B
MSTKANPEKLKQIIEGALLAAGRPLSIDQILTLFLDEEQPGRDEIRAALQALQQECESRGVELKEVSTGFRYQVKADLAPWIARLWEEKPARYSRAAMETLALIAYRQPITRGEIEDVRGVAVSTQIIKSLLEREWVRVVGHRDVPGKPALYGTTRMFLDYFNLKSLSDLPPLAELRNIESIEHEFDFGDKPQAANDAEEGVKVQPIDVGETEAEASQGDLLETSGEEVVAEEEADLSDTEETGVAEEEELLSAEVDDAEESVADEASDSDADKKAEVTV